MMVINSFDNNDDDQKMEIKAVTYIRYIYI